MKVLTRFKEPIGEYIYQYCKNANIHPAELAASISVDEREMVNLMEGGRASKDAIEKLENFFQLDLMEYIGN
ncbi:MULTISPECIES: hypothetical protein [unclassified Psychrobacillus]|uniref:hypothetical protein n=1 Tax=unclassified Psychrobacillus TaxID=2636677 RepID=UPI0030F96F6B